MFQTTNSGAVNLWGALRPYFAMLRPESASERTVGWVMEELLRHHGFVQPRALEPVIDDALQQPPFQRPRAV
jgi:hypothetical protein